MNLQELFDDFNKIEQKKEKLQREIKFLDKMKETRLEILEKSILFNGNVVIALANLMSKKEKEKYVPFIYNRILYLFVGDKYNVDNYYVGITKYDNIRTLEKGDNIENLLESGCVYPMFLSEYDVSDETVVTDKFVSLYFPFSKPKNNIVTFKYLLDEYNISSFFPLVKIIDFNFENFEYIKDFIRYLIDLQIQNNGKKLTYDEMNSAIYEFLNMNTEKVKKITRK